MAGKRKICFCTVAKNRLHHLRETLPINIQANLDYERLQFVVLDYNSEDGLEGWMKSQMVEHLRSEKLVFYKTTDPAFFNRSHSRNMVMKLAEGDIVCNIDADNFTGPFFAKYVNDCFQADQNIFICTYSSDRNPRKDVLGRICLKKIDFTSIGGYDESMEHYGFEDYDLINRLQLLGLKRIVIDKPEFLNVITHSDYERISEERIMKLFHRLYIQYIDQASSKIIILLKNGTCLIGKLIDCESLYSGDPVRAFSHSYYDYEYNLENEKWAEGKWIENEKALRLNTVTKEIRLKKHKTGVLINSGNTFYEITDKDLIIELLLFYSEFLNRASMKKNLDLNNVKLSNNDFGRGTVFKNFDNKVISI